MNHLKTKIGKQQQDITVSEACCCSDPNWIVNNNMRRSDSWESRSGEREKGAELLSTFGLFQFNL